MAIVFESSHSSGMPIIDGHTKNMPLPVTVTVMKRPPASAARPQSESRSRFPWPPC